MLMLIDLCIADRRGRNGASNEPLTDDFPDVDMFKKNVEQAGVTIKGIEPLLKGADVMDIVSPGPYMGKLLRLAYEKQIEKNITDKQVLKEYIIKNIKK
jgi:hypothetical protein